VIFITALSEEEDEAKGLRLGAVDFITKPFNPALVKARVRNHLELKRHRDHLESLVRERTEETVLRLVLASEARDTDTGMHVRRIRAASALMARKLGMPEGKAELIGLASTMHDVGKIGIPDHILLKDGRLNDAEWEIMKTHTTIGARNLEGSTSRLLEVARTIALHHHEHWDGSGYPGGLSGQDISLEGRVVCILDVFDALTSKRPYKEAWPSDRALDTMRQLRGRHFDPELVDVFLGTAPDFVALRSMYPDEVLLKKAERSLPVP